MPEPMVEGRASPGGVAVRREGVRPRLGSTAFDDDGRSARRRPRVEALTRARQHPSAGWRWPDPATDGRARSRASTCSRIWGWPSPPMVPSTAWSVAVGTGDQRGRERVGRATPGPVLGGVAGHEGEPDAPVVQDDPGRRLEEVAAEARGVRLDQRHAHALAVDGAQVGGVVRRSPPDGSAASAAAEASDGIPSRGEPRRCRAARRRRRRPTAPPDGPARPPSPRRPGRPPRRRSSGSSGRPSRSASQAAGQRQVALRRGRHGPEVVVPDAQAERRDPLGQGPGEVVGRVLACPSARRPSPNSPP